MTHYAPQAHIRRPHVDLRLVAAVVFAAAFAGLGAWVLVDRYTGGATPTEQATTLLDKWYAAASANDAAALFALHTANSVTWSDGTKFVGANAIANEIAATPGLTIHRIAPVSVSGDFASTFIRFSVPIAGIDGPMADLYQFKDGKIFRHWAFALGVTPPFDNTALPTVP